MTITLEPAEEKDLEFARQLYLDSFPAEERRPWDTIVSPSPSAHGPQLNIVADRHTGMPIGIVSLWRFDGFTYIEHLAIHPSHRSNGIGSQVLHAIATAIHSPVVVEVEPPTMMHPMASRRIDFYRRNGFDILPYRYIQPPYGPHLPSVELLLMSTSPAPDAHLVANTLYKYVYGVDI